MDRWMEGRKEKEGYRPRNEREEKKKEKKKSIASSFPALIQWVISVSMAR